MQIKKLSILVYGMVCFSACSHKIPQDFIGNWCGNNNAHQCIEITWEDHYGKAIQYYTDGSGPNSALKLVYDEKKNQLKSRDHLPLIVSLDKKGKENKLIVSYGNKTETYLKAEGTIPPWKK